MTPAARYGAAIEILDQILDGVPVEKALTGWARRSRFAGSKDRAAIRDHVFEAVRRKRSSAALGGSATGRGMVLGLLRGQGVDPQTVFSGEGHAPAALTEDEQAAGDTPQGGAALDLPDWLLPALEQSLGDGLNAYAETLQSRAPVMLRVNLRKTTRAAAIAALEAEGITAIPASISDTALIVTAGERKINNAAVYQQGRVELQDGASQALVDALPLREGMKILDLCAGGGGKSLAIAGRVKAEIYAFDANVARLKDLPERARRAGAKITICKQPEAHGPFDLILCDVPCSGSGSWRRAPQGKWGVTPESLSEISDIQRKILDRAAVIVADGGTLAYATCSVLDSENRAPVEAFVSNTPRWQETRHLQWLPGPEGDGFALSLLTEN